MYFGIFVCYLQKVQIFEKLLLRKIHFLKCSIKKSNCFDIFNHFRDLNGFQLLQFLIFASGFLEVRNKTTAYISARISGYLEFSTIFEIFVRSYSVFFFESLKNLNFCKNACKKDSTRIVKRLLRNLIV